MNKLFSVLLFLSISFAALALDATQKAALKTAAETEPTLTQAIASGNDSAVVDWFNANSTFIVWRTNVSCREYHEGALVWTSVDAMTIGKGRIWDLMCKYEYINPSKLGIRQGFADAFGAASATTTAATALSKRPATNAEKVLATGTGTTGSPGLLTFEGRISVNDVSSILRP